MRLTPLEWGLRAPITPRLGGNRWALPRLGKSELNEEKQTTQNTKLRILPELLRQKMDLLIRRVFGR